MHRLNFFIAGVLALVLTGCGQTVIETLNVPENPGFNAPGVGKSVVILPFADYSGGANIESAHRRNMIVTETLTDRFVANGFSLPIQEDVFQYMINQNVISLMAYEDKRSSSMNFELTDGDWSPQMRNEIKKYIAEQENELKNDAITSPGAHGLTPKTIAKIGRQFDADYIIRGRILEFKTREEATWEPWKKGLLPFINNGTNRILFGFADSDEYDLDNNKITGGIYGARIGYESSHWPWGSGDTVLGISGGDTANSILWGAIGYGLGENTYNSGKVDQAVVQLRIWVQEAATGNVVWTNRVRVQVSPESFLADNQYDTLFNKAIEKGVTTLIENFVTYGL
ncbi:hypothetical protein [Desulfopila sp. IMCC35008]|uniref:hypothetical protein n=1 Tax=Desulfopila sp. IMCC35008 TaxID=2653858 RepID=UPI0013D68A65|nr:hypothetical protein [Desulfopila sp. IMCC35008]